jgi:hypothetical protein
MNHELAEKAAGLASRVSSLSNYHTGEPQIKLIEQKDRLSKLLIAAIVKELNQEHEAYKAAISGMNEAIEFIGDADKELEGIAKAIRLIRKAIDALEQALKKAV